MVKQLVRFAWLGAFPLVAALVTTLFVAPRMAASVPSAYWLGGAFLSFALLVRYWRAHLPGARYLLDDALEARKPFALEQLVSTGAWVVGAALLALGLRAMVQLYDVTSSSMLPSLRNGDTLLVNKLAYRLGGAPQRGDAIVFERVIDGEARVLVKRVVGLPGDRVAMRGPVPVVNGTETGYCLAGRYVYFGADVVLDARIALERLGKQASLAAYAPQFTEAPDEYLVKPGELFVLGDNRNDSVDSRSWKSGVPLSTVIGRAERLMLGAVQDGSRPLSSMLSAIGDRFEVPGVDMRELRQGVESCRKQEREPKQASR